MSGSDRRDRGGPTVHTGSLDGGEVRTVVADHGFRITLMGPATFPTGEPVAFTADVDGTDDWAWVGPDNAMVVGSDQSARLELEPRRPGEATLGAGRPGR